MWITTNVFYFYTRTPDVEREDVAATSGFVTILILFYLFRELGTPPRGVLPVVAIVHFFLVRGPLSCSPRVLRVFWSCLATSFVWVM